MKILLSVLSLVSIFSISNSALACGKRCCGAHVVWPVDPAAGNGPQVPAPIARPPQFSNPKSYLCSDESGEFRMSVNPTEMRAEVYQDETQFRMTCQETNNGQVWLTCEGMDHRSFVFNADKKSGVFFDFSQNTNVNCVPGSG